MEIRKIVRNGNCLCVNIPGDYLRYLGVKKGSEVIVVVGNNELTIMKRGKSDGKSLYKEINKHG